MAGGVTCVCIIATLVDSDRVDTRKPDGRYLYFSGKHKTFGVNVQLIATADEDILWV